MKRLFTILIVLAAIGASVAVQAATGYTDRDAFDAATAGYIQKTITNFDLQAAGTPATSYGSLSIAADGLASDGATSVALSPVATDAYTPTSTPNSMGPSTDNQFLAGNSDTITFTFSSPLYAFGLYLVGNPSPTGDPPIPFWRMRANNTDAGFDAYSATDPLYSLGAGNDVYFLGIVSTDQPFTQVTLHSDNDPAAVFSFNVDDLVYATLPAETTIADAKTMATGEVRIKAVVTRVHSDRFNIETADRTFGMTVLGTGATRGKGVTLTGNVTGTSDDERAIVLYGIVSEADSAAPGSFGMGSKSVGGATTSGLQIGIPDSQGPNNIGLDATIWGTITGKAADDSWITVDDGAGRASGKPTTGVKVVGAINAAGRSIGDFVVVRGSVSLWKSGSSHYPLIRVAQASDIAP
ncbi:MAG: hypothetical protein HYX78_14855 [Armatimonadetes bacterium]|nr:hypothetical protein [Armatimonadota bacterium]